MADSLAIDPSGLWRGKSKREREREREDGRVGREKLEMDGSMEEWIPPARSSVTNKKRVKREGRRRDTETGRGKGRRVAESAVTSRSKWQMKVRYSDYTYRGPHPLWRVELGKTYTT